MELFSGIHLPDFWGVCAGRIYIGVGKMTPEQAYTKYRHLDDLLSDPSCMTGPFKDYVLKELWEAVKGCVEGKNVTQSEHSNGNPAGI